MSDDDDGEEAASVMEWKKRYYYYYLLLDLFIFLIIVWKNIKNKLKLPTMYRAYNSPVLFDKPKITNV